MKKETLSKEEHKKYMLETPIARLTMAFSVPSMVSTLITSIYNLSDTYFVSTISTKATAAVGVVFSINMILIALGFWSGTGASTLTSNLLGEGDNAKAQRITSSAFWLSTAFGLIVAIVFFIGGDNLLITIGATDEIIAETRAYAFWILLSAPFSTSTMMLGQALRAEGLAKESMVGNVAGALINIILDPIFIFVFKMGINGAALATFLSVVIGWAILVSNYFLGKTQMHLSIRYISRNTEDYKQIFTIGFPSLCRHICNTSANIVLNRVAGTFGVAPIAAMSICSRLLYLTNAISGGINNGSQPIIGYAYGNKKMERVKEAFIFAVKVSVTSLVVFGIFGFIFSNQLIGLFSKDTEVISYGTLAFRFICIALPFACFLNSASILFQVIKKPIISSSITVVRQIIIYIPILLILPNIINELGIQLAGPIADVTVGLLCIPLCIKQINQIVAEGNN